MTIQPLTIPGACLITLPHSDDVRGSLTFGKCGSVVLGAETPQSLYLPVGLAHGFYTLSAEAAGLTPGKFVTPNPFGPYEEGRLSSYLAKCWLTGVEPALQTPDLARDFVPVDLLAASYRPAME